ncbi:glycosyltransferase family 1 protein [Aureimonas sp. AU20]|uniref:rhamnosyltransferase WsaF family glycosyltransferase n=1 Tax=Aureimonas sp. AU20 TaxID=1349819 RepID=UPI0007211E32|nr:glycosyltransferase family 1 protein [Aureimonas sp. AU20]ALN74689.1 hypothetical protein M673_18380 [Aureimonas sp. AU20]
MNSHWQGEIMRRARQVRSTWRQEGPYWVADRVRTTLADRIRPKIAVSPVRPADVVAADLHHPRRVSMPPLREGEPVALNWVMSPPSRGSGGHTTLFRLIRHLEANGYRNRVYFYDPYRGDHRYYEEIVHDAYGFAGLVAPVEEGMADAHGIVATTWSTAYPVFNARSAGKRFYLVQDFEPMFHATSSDSILAENTYRMPFHAITAGRWLAERLRGDYGMEADHFDFSCDTARYRRIGDRARSGIAFYARPNATRRGFELGLMALELFARRRPDITIHLYGDTIGRLPFPFVDHGLVTPDALNAIYNQCFAGLSLSLTNVSLVPLEMLAAGCIPVMNDALHNRMVLGNPHIRYAPPSPHELAAELEAVVSAPDFASLSRQAAASVEGLTWSDAGARVDAIIRRSLAASQVSSPTA